MPKKPQSDETTLNSMEELAGVTVANTTETVIPGNAIEITIKDEALAEDSFLVTSLLQGLANTYQNLRIKAEDIVADMEKQLKENLEGVVDTDTGEMIKPPKTDPDTGEVIGLTENQEMLMMKLEDQLDAIALVFKDLNAAWAQYNENPVYKLLYQTDSERRRNKAQYQAQKQKEKSGIAALSMEEQRKAREERRARRQALVENAA